MRKHAALDFMGTSDTRNTPLSTILHAAAVVNGELLQSAETLIDRTSPGRHFTNTSMARQQTGQSSKYDCSTPAVVSTSKAAGSPHEGHSTMISSITRA